MRRVAAEGHPGAIRQTAKIDSLTATGDDDPNVFEGFASPVCNRPLFDPPQAVELSGRPSSRQVERPRRAGTVKG